MGILSHTFSCITYLFYYIYSLNLVNHFVNEKPLCWVTNKVCMSVCTLIRELLCVFQYNFCLRSLILTKGERRTCYRLASTVINLRKPGTFCLQNTVKNFIHYGCAHRQNVMRNRNESDFKSEEEIAFLWTGSNSVIDETTILILNVIIQYYSQDKDSVKEFV